MVHLIVKETVLSRNKTPQTTVNHALWPCGPVARFMWGGVADFDRALKFCISLWFPGIYLPQTLLNEKKQINVISSNLHKMRLSQAPDNVLCNSAWYS